MGTSHSNVPYRSMSPKIAALEGTMEQRSSDAFYEGQGIIDSDGSVYL